VLLLLPLLLLLLLLLQVPNPRMTREVRDGRTVAPHLLLLLLLPSLPLLLLLLPLLLLLLQVFPNLHVIHEVRDGRDVALSNLNSTSLRTTRKFQRHYIETFAGAWLGLEFT
jgi:hypothetical protein